jgi:CspA family cold shock protein
MKYTGVVKWYNATKGYGFITPDNGQKDAFVHSSAVSNSGLSGLHENQKVEYTLVKNAGKDSADDIVILD